jgi:hypothetical protein
MFSESFFDSFEVFVFKFISEFLGIFDGVSHGVEVVVKSVFGVKCPTSSIRKYR